MNELVEVRLWSETGPACDCEWPVGLPRNFDELFRDYGDFIAKKVASFNKIKRNEEDLFQEICCKIISSDLLNKFVARAARMLPETFYAAEAAALMGLTFDEFQVALYYKSHMGLSFEPRDGEIVNDHDLARGCVPERALFNSGDIQALDEAYPKFDQKARTLTRQIIWPLQALGFPAYLTQAIHNHFANWCRTRKRKYQDMLLPGSTILSATPGGGYTQVGYNPEATDWEARLVEMTMADDDLISIVESTEREFASAGMDVRDITETEDYQDDEGRTRQRPTAKAARSLDLLEAVIDRRATHPKPHRKPLPRYESTLFGDGRTVREAVRIQQRTEMRAKARLNQVG